MSPENTHTIPWDAWFEDKSIPIKFPDNWNIDTFKLTQSEPVDKSVLLKEADQLIRKILKQTPANIAIAVDDLTRPLSYASFFDYILEQLEIFLKDHRVFIIIGLGTHAPLTEEELQKKLGSRAMSHKSVTVKNHDYKNDVKYAGFEWGKIPVKINKYFLNADFRVIFSTMVPHPFAGFSGGPKMVIPGLSNIEIAKRSHQMVLMGFVGNTGNVTENKFRNILDSFTEKIRIDYFVGFLSGIHRQCVGVKGGALHETYYRMAKEAVESYTVKVPDKNYNIIWLNAYPKDNELLQIDTAFIPILSAKNKFWNDGTTFVISAACSKGMGSHGLFGPGGLLYRKPQKRRNLKQNKLIFFIPGFNEQDFHMIYFSEYLLYNNLEQLLLDLKKSNATDVNVALFPHASIELVT